jgi:hypothetical protein
MSPSRGLAALAAVAALSLSACTNNDVDGDDLVDAMTDAGLPQDEAECMGERFQAEFDQEQRNDIAAADDPEDIPSGLQEPVDSIITECTSGSESADDGSESGDEGDEGTDETTTTTEAEGG